jgi:divalent metal cation (Fe/Co/Zn/Cd) transporter
MMNAARNTDGVISIHRFRARMQAGGIQVDMHLQVNANSTVQQGYLIGKQVENNITNCDSSVRDVIARVEPFSPCGDADSCIHKHSREGIYTED